MITALLALSLAVSQTSAHMKMTFPPPLLSPDNPNTGNSGKADYSYTSPLSASGSDFPCKGHLSALGTPQGVSVATFRAGEKYNFTVTGGANHNGGSCQASLSYDRGKTFAVIQSYEGGCPPAGTSHWDFTVPADAASGEALFAWTWLNAIGNREMYMNCAAVTIAGEKVGKRRDGGDGGDDDDLVTRVVAYNKRPSLFVANIGNGCTTPEGFQYQFPDPGPDLSTSSAEGAKFTQLSCGPSASASASASASVPAPASASNPSPTTPASTAASTTATASVPAATMSATNSSSTTTPDAVFITTPPASASNATATSTMSSGSDSDASSPTLPASLPTQTGTGPSTGSDPAASTGGSSPSPPAVGSITAGTKCANEGDWNCLGSSFQRCASGAWSVAMPMPPGTTCKPGVSSTLTYARLVRRVAPRRASSPWTGSGVGVGMRVG